MPTLVIPDCYPSSTTHTRTHIMASKKTKAAPAGDDIDELFDVIATDAPKKSSEKKPKAGKAVSTDQDILAELEKDLEKPSRPHTPRVREPAPKGSPARRTATPTADDRAAPRKSTDSARFTPSATSSDLPEPEKTAPEQGGGWWGGIFSTASAAMKQAEAAVKEIRENEEAKKWAEQVRGNVGGLRALGEEPHDSTDGTRLF